MTAARSALVVGAGVAGMTAALMLRRAGVEVRLIDLATAPKPAGAGLTISASTLRAMQFAGLLDAVKRQGHTHAGIRVCDVAGRAQRLVTSPPLPDADVPGAGGILRPTLHAIMAAQLAAVGVPVQAGLTVVALEQDAVEPGDIESRNTGVRATLSDGSVVSVDMVVGADGLFSSMRRLLFPAAPAPCFTGQACWRMVLPRPPEIDMRHFYLGGPVKAGLTPVSQEEMYLFLLEQVPGNPRREEDTQHTVLAGLLAGFGGILADICRGLNRQSRIVYRPLESHLLPQPWWRGRTILIGDAAHATTPQLASGAGMALEDGIVLAEEVARAATPAAAFAGFMRRRFARCRLVVENSLEIGRLEMAKAPASEQTAVVERSLAALAAPI